MAKYHITKNGDAKECYANVGKCPFGDVNEHYPTMGEAQYAYEMKANGEFGVINSVSDVFKSTPLKNMDPSMLSRSLVHEAKEAGITDTSKLEEAIDVATILHQNQRRRNRGDLPKTAYIEHPLRNSIRLLRMGVKDEKTIVASILHDTVEDGSHVFAKKFNTGTAKIYNEEQKRTQLANFIGARYGDEVKQTVLDVSNPLQTEEEKQEQSHEVKIAKYNAHVEDNVSKNPRAYLVKLSDWLDNAAGLHYNDVSTENGEKIVKQAKKYLPTAETFKRNVSQIDGYLSKSEQKEVLHKINNGVQHLKRIIDKKP